MSAVCSSGSYHIPVLATQVLKALAIRKDGIYVDCTLGGGGHSSLILSQLGPKGRLLAIDRDEKARFFAGKALAEVETEAEWEIIAATFSDLKTLLKERNISYVDGVLADLGVSSAQIEQAERGFSYRVDGPLDMRMDNASGRSAANWLQETPEEEVKRTLREYGEERYAGRIAKAIKAAVAAGAVHSTTQLSEVIAQAMPKQSKTEKQHPARRSFQAIRIAVNDELGELESLLSDLPTILNDRARVAIISFHSLEDRIVKNKYRQWQESCTCPKDFPVCVCGKKTLGTIVTKRPITAGAEEIAENRKAHSAKLRVFERRWDDERVSWRKSGI